MASKGQRISEYVLDERLGAGTFGEVWRAHHHVWVDHVVAVKIPTDPRYVKSLQKEGKAIHGLVHPNIVRAMGFDPFGEPAYLVMEYVAGKSLREVMRERKLLVSEAVEVMRQVLAGLGYAHGRGVIHRDVKPENALMASDGVVKVADFGLGKAMEVAAHGGAESIVYSGSVGASEGIAGSVQYMAPEQRDGAEVDGRADLYACGVILFEMLTGERPAGTEVPSERNPSVPKYLDEVFRRSYARLDKRFGSAEEFALALREGVATPPPLPINRVLHVDAKTAMCPHCKRQVDKGDQFCMYCGTQLVKEIRRCWKCGGWPDVSDRFCLLCGERLAEARMPA